VVYDAALAERIRAMLASRADVEEVRMFGGLTFMVGGQMCCGVLKDDLVVRVGAEAFDAALAQPHARPMDFTRRPMPGMVYVAPPGVASEADLRGWIQRATDYVAAHPAKRRRR